jgi:hypothetical protein
MYFENLKTTMMRSIRAVIIVFFCTLMIFSSAFPAMALGSSRSNPTEGDTHLDEIFENSERALKNEPNRSMKDYANTAEKGPNEIQGGADFRQMKRSDNTNATTIQDQVEELLENVVGDKDKK